MLLVSTFVGFVAMMYWIALSKLMPVTGNKVRQLEAELICHSY